MGILKNNIETSFFEQWADCFKEPILLVDEFGKVIFSNKMANHFTQAELEASTSFKNAVFYSNQVTNWKETSQTIKEQKEFVFTCSLPSFQGSSMLKIRANWAEHNDVDYYILHVIGMPDKTKEVKLSVISQDILSGILKNTNEAFLFLDAVSREIIDCNERAVELFEVEHKHELIGLKGTDLHVHPITEEQKQMESEGEDLSYGREYETIYKSTKNKKFWARINILKLMLDPFPLLLVRITDIDKEKKALDKLILSEKKYRDLITYNQALICTHDMNGVIISVNPACKEALQLEEHDIIGRNIRMLFDDKRINKYEEYLKKINEEDQASGIMEVLNKHGEKMYWIYNNHKVSEEGEEPYVVGSARDITERMIMEKELIQAKTQAISSLKARELFLANVSHEIRTPMNGIIGVLELLNKTSLTNLQEKYIDIIQNSSERLLVIINDILDYAKIESGTIHMENVPFDIVATSMSVIQPLLLKGMDKKIDLQVDVEKPECILVLGDPYRYGQVITNLINNALKFTNNGSVAVIGKVLSEEENTVEYEITVKDTGIGISKEDISKIFDEFTQAHISHARKYGGTGLGLSICKKLIEMQGGTLKVLSEPDKGSEFIITYSFIKAANCKPDRLIQTKVDPNAIKGIYMLLVEDNEVNQYIVKTVAELNGIKIDVANTGLKAIAMMHKTTYDVVLMDIQMPDMDGIETTYVIREKLQSSIPIIAYTANAMKGDLEKYIKNGMNDYLSKPLKEDELLNKIGNVLQLPFIETDIVMDKTECGMNSEDNLYSTAYLKTLGNNRPEFIRAMLVAFVNSIPKELDRLNTAFHAEDINEMKVIVHKIKSSARTLMISSIEDTIYFVEKYPESSLNDRFNTAIGTIIDVLKQVGESIKKDLQ